MIKSLESCTEGHIGTEDEIESYFTGIISYMYCTRYLSYIDPKTSSEGVCQSTVGGGHSNSSGGLDVESIRRQGY